MNTDSPAYPFPTVESTLDLQFKTIAACEDVPALKLGLPMDSQQVVPTEDFPTGSPFKPWVQFRNPTPYSLHVSIGIFRSDREFGPGDLLNLHLASDEILDRRDQLLQIGLDSDILSVRTQNPDLRFITRSAAFKHGQIAFSVDVSVLEQDYVNLAEHVFGILSSIRILASPILTAEPIQTVSLNEPLPLRFSLPQSWRFHRTESGNDLCHVSVENLVGDDVVGRVNVIHLSGAYSTELLDRLHNSLDRIGFELSELQLQPVALESGDVRTIGYANAWNPSGAVLDVSFAHFIENNACVWIDLLTVQRDAAPILWIQNKRCFEIIADSITTIIPTDPSNLAE